MTNKKIFGKTMQGIICSMQTFVFDKLTIKTKKQLQILENVGIFGWLAFKPIIITISKRFSLFSPL